MWFNTPYYHLLYQHRDETEANGFIDRLSLFLRLSERSAATVLDLACGKGRHAARIAANFPALSVLGLDLADESIAQARQQYPHLANLRFGVHHILDSLQPYPRFDLVLNLFTSFGYFETDEEHLQILQHVRQSLTEQGLLVLDFMNVETVIAQLVSSETKLLNGVEFAISRTAHDGFIRKNIRIHDPQAQPPNLEFAERVKIYRLADFQKLFAAAGLELLHHFGDYQLQAFEPAHSSRLILVARRAQVATQS